MLTPTTPQEDLPDGFDDFLPFLSWALESQSARSAKKMSSTFEEIKTLYDLGMENNRVGDALAYCDRFPFDEMPPDARRLFLITLSMAEVRPQAELYGVVHADYTAHPSRLPMAIECDRI